MKLIDLLVKELPKSGGWPSEAVTAIYFRHKKGVTLYDKDGMGIKKGVSFIFMDIHGVRRKKVTKEEFEAALAKNDGWIEWGGGECPVERGCVVDYKVQGCEGVLCGNSHHLRWSHDADWQSGNIIAYRLHKPEINSRANDDRLENDLNECIGQAGEPKAWFPAVGEICQARIGGEWTDVKVAYIGDEGSWNEALVFDVKSTRPAWADEFQPMRTDAEKAREEAIEFIREIIDAKAGDPFNSARFIYECMMGGKIPGVKLEDK